MIKVFAKAAATTGRQRGMLFWLWIVDSLFALAVVAPLILLIDSDFSHSLAADNFGRLNLMNLADLTYRHQDLGTPLIAALVSMTLIFLVLSTFLNGGIIGFIVDGNREKTLRTFIAGCGKYFLRFWIVSVLALPAYVIVLGPLFRLASAPLNAWIMSAPAEWPVIIASLIKLLLMIFLLSIVQMVVGYVKIDIAVEHRPHVSTAVRAALAFLGRRFFGAWGLYLLTGAIFIASGGVFLVMTGFLPPAGITAPWAGFLLAQLFIAARVGIKILFLAGEYHFYQIHRKRNQANASDSQVTT